MKANSEDRCRAVLDVFQTKLVQAQCLAQGAQPVQRRHAAASGKVPPRRFAPAGHQPGQRQEGRQAHPRRGPETVKTQIMGDELRVTSKSWDDLTGGPAAAPRRRPRLRGPVHELPLTHPQPKRHVPAEPVRVTSRSPVRGRPCALRMPWSAKCRVCRPGRRPRHVRSLRSLFGSAPAPSACLGQRNARYVGPAADQGTSETSGAPFAVGPAHSACLGQRNARYVVQRRPRHVRNLRSPFAVGPGALRTPWSAKCPVCRSSRRPKHVPEAPDAQDPGRLHGEEPPPRHQGLTQRPVPVDESPAGRGRQIGAGQGLG